jgi:hypothetical protein
MRPSKRVFARAGILAATAAVASVASVAFVGASTPPTKYYACLQAGTLSKVGTAAPACAAPAQRISWSSTPPAGVVGPPGPSGAQGPQGPPGLASPPKIASLTRNNVFMIPGQTVKVANFTISLAQPGHVLVEASTFFYLPADSALHRMDAVQCKATVDAAQVDVAEATVETPGTFAEGFQFSRVPLSLEGVTSAVAAAGPHTVEIDCWQYTGSETDLQAYTTSVVALQAQ